MRRRECENCVVEKDVATSDLGLRGLARGLPTSGDGNKFLYSSGKICIPETVANEILKEWHEGKLGHAGKAKMRKVVEARFVITDAEDRIARLLRGFQICQAMSYPTHKEESRSPHPVPEHLGAKPP